MNDLKETNAKVQKVLDTANGMLDEDREKIKGSIDDLQRLLKTTNATVEQLQSIMNANSDNLDSMLDNFRQISENFRMFSDTVKRQPSSLIWKDTQPDRTPGGGKPAKPDKMQKTAKGGN